jgi:hypothetical protein
MSNFMNNVFNPPATVKIGQIWHCEALNRNLLITEADESYTYTGIVRAMIIKKSGILADEMEVPIELDELLGLALGKVNTTMRITDGPVCTDDLSFYCGDIPEKYISEVKRVVNERPNYTEEQMFVINDILDELQPLRDKALRKVDEAAKKFVDSLQEINILEVLKSLNQPEEVHDYGMVASGGSNEAGAVAFWEKERKGTPIKIDSQISETEFYLTIVDDGLYFLCYSKKFSSISNIRLYNGSFEVPAGKGSVAFGSRKKIFAHISGANLLSEGVWELSFEADGENYRIPFLLS